MIDFSNNFVDNSIPTLSVSEMISMISHSFDRDRVVELTYNKHFNNPDSQYYQKSKDEIVKMWEDKAEASRNYGKMLDDYIGSRLNNDMFISENMNDRLQGLMKSFDDFYEVMMKSGDMEFICREKTLYTKFKFYNDNNEEIEYYIKGRFDALFKNNRIGKYVLIDWKSSGSIDKIQNRWTKNLLSPMDKFPELNWYTYTTQLYYYKYALLKNYLKDVSADDIICMIVQLPGKLIEGYNTTYAIHQVAYQYDPVLLEKLFISSIKKKYNEDIKLKEVIVEDDIKTQNDIITNIF